MTHVDLIQLFDREFPGCGWKIWVWDAEYAVPSARSFKRAFESDFAEFMGVVRQLILRKVDYSTNDFDCEDFAILGRACVSMMNVVNRRERRSNRAIPAGVLCYNQGGVEGNGHAINFCVVDRDGKDAVMFFEPQTGREIQLTEEERCSVFGGFV